MYNFLKITKNGVAQFETELLFVAKEVNDFICKGNHITLDNVEYEIKDISTVYSKLHNSDCAELVKTNIYLNKVR